MVIQEFWEMINQKTYSMKKCITTAMLIICICALVKAHSQETVKHLAGQVNRDSLLLSPHNEWFTNNYNTYVVNDSIINTIKPQMPQYNLTLFMGTWCGDSKKQVPAIYKILDALKFPEDKLKIIAVNRESESYKQSPQHEEEGLNIHRVPTLIFYKDEIEVNRIIESPVESLEKDFAAIVTQNTYTHRYQIVSFIDSILQQGGLTKLQQSHEMISAHFENQVQSIYELNTYAYVLFSSSRKLEALEVYLINTELFPNNSFAHQSLANMYTNLNYSKEAVISYQKALELDPDNKQLQEKVAALSK